MQPSLSPPWTAQQVKCSPVHQLMHLKEKIIYIYNFYVTRPSTSTQGTKCGPEFAIADTATGKVHIWTNERCDVVTSINWAECISVNQDLGPCRICGYGAPGTMGNLVGLASRPSAEKHLWQPVLHQSSSGLLMS